MTKHQPIQNQGESEYSEKRRITFNEADVCCRYLSVNLPKWPPNEWRLEGRFGDYLKKLGIEKFPFRIHLPDLLCSGVLQPSLYVNLPKSYFEQWSNFPLLPQDYDKKDQSGAGMYDCQILSHLANDLNDCIHPYDGSLRQEFTEQFQSEVPPQFIENQHPNGAKFIAAEAYIPYWQGYALAAVFRKYLYAERYLPFEEGKHHCLKMLKDDVLEFTEKYQEAFERISWYKTVVNAANLSSFDCTQGQVFSLAQKHSQVNLTQLKQDLHLLLCLDYSWAELLKKYGCIVLQNARTHLSQDIYWMYEQLRLIGCDKKSLLDEFQPQDCGGGETALFEVLEFEHYRFQRAFCDFGSHYSSDIKQWGYLCTEPEFVRLNRIAGFDSWVRAFCDMHNALQNRHLKPVTFKQERIVDALIVLSVRTEIVLREMFRPVLQSQSDETLVQFLKNIQNKLPAKVRRVLETCCNESSKTKLYSRPPEIFLEIEKFEPINWSQKHIYFLQALLKFITARNYFAHHAYKDSELNRQSSDLSEQILKSLLSTLLFFDKHFLQEQNLENSHE